MWCHVSIHSSLVVTTASAAVSERKRIVVVVVVRARRTMKTFAVVGRDFALGWGLLTSKSHRLESAVRETRILWQNHKRYFDYLNVLNLFIESHISFFLSWEKHSRSSILLVVQKDEISHEMKVFSFWYIRLTEQIFTFPQSEVPYYTIQLHIEGETTMNSNATIDTLIQLLGLLREITAVRSTGGGGKKGDDGGLKYEPPPL